MEKKVNVVVSLKNGSGDVFLEIVKITLVMTLCYTPKFGNRHYETINGESVNRRTVEVETTLEQAILLKNYLKSNYPMVDCHFCLTEGLKAKGLSKLSPFSFLDL